MHAVLKKSNIIYFLLFLISSISILVIKDYGIGIEEHFQRKSGFYWLQHLLSFTDFEYLKNETNIRIKEINIFTPNLFPIEKYSYYGILFDLPLAFVETYFSINEPLNYFYLRHLVTLFFFLLSAHCFYKTINLRFNNLYLAILGFLIFIYTPRIYGNIFFDNKDIFFLSIFTINIYYYFKFNSTNKYVDLIIFSMFCAFSTSSRIIGLLIPLSFLFILLFNSLNIKKNKKNLIIFLIFITSYSSFLFIHWPYLWTLELNQWLNFFSPFFKYMNPMVFFNSEFYESKHLPISYLPYWIFISTPVYITLFFILGFSIQFRRFFLRFINIKETNKIEKNDLWRSNNEKFDLFILLILLLVILIYISSNLALLSGWRHFYFLNFFLIYFTCYSIYLFLIKARKSKQKIFFLFFCIFVFLLIQALDLYKYHPFQSSYFNNLVSKNKKEKFEIDTQSLSRVHAIKEILKEQADLITIGTGSWTPLADARSLISREKWNRLNFVGTNFENADFIYSNHYYEVDINYNKKYQVPKNFSIYKTLLIDDTMIYSIYKKNKK